MMTKWCGSRREIETLVSKLIKRRSVSEKYLSNVKEFAGYCVSCGDIVNFKNHVPSEGIWNNLRESFICPRCGLNGRMRHAYVELASIIDSRSKPKVLIFECTTPFFSSIEKIYPDVEGCEFVGPNFSPGQIVTDGILGRSFSVRHEDMMAISSPANSLDIIFHADVLEHVPDYIQAIKECHRSLKAGGILLFTCPFFFIEENIIRAKVENGVVKHILDPAYHDNPISQTGSLVYTQHGWPLLEEIKEIGFESIHAGLLWDPWQGILSTNNPYIEGQMWPLMFRCIKGGN